MILLVHARHHAWPSHVGHVGVRVVKGSGGVGSVEWSYRVGSRSGICHTFYIYTFSSYFISMSVLMPIPLTLLIPTPLPYPTSIPYPHPYTHPLLNLKN